MFVGSTPLNQQQLNNNIRFLKKTGSKGKNVLYRIKIEINSNMV